MKANELKPPDLDGFTEVHKCIGMALWHSQAFEDVLCHFVALTLKLPESKAK